MTFGYVPHPCGEWWPVVSAMLEPAAVRGGDTVDEVDSDLAAGLAQLWLTIEHGVPVAAMVTRIDGDTLEVWLAGGAVLSGSVPFLETALSAAQAAGVTNGRIKGRKGWQRVLRGYGWRCEGDFLVKDCN